MTVRIVMGTALSGKTHFIKEIFPDSILISVGEYQRRLMAEKRKAGPMPIGEYRAILQAANDQIKKDMIELLAQGKDVIMEHTLYKAAWRKEYLEAFGTVTDEPIDIYVMQPSDERLLQNIQTNDEQKERGIGWIKWQMREIEMPCVSEGFAHVYVVNDNGIQDYSNILIARKFIDRDTKMTVIRKDFHDKTKEKRIVSFTDKPFWHICECCGKAQVLSSKEAYEQGWDYPGEGAVFPSSMFGVLSPRTCGHCGIKATAYWAIVFEGKKTAELSENQLQAVERITQEPEILRVDD